MSPGGRTNPNRWIALSDLAACLLGYGVAVWLYWGFVNRDYWGAWQPEWTRETVVSAVTGWIAIAFVEGGRAGGFRVWIDRSFSTIGFNLMVQYGFSYLFGMQPAPWPIALAGSLLAVASIGVLRSVLHPWLSRSPSILILGGGPVAEALSVSLAGRVAGELADLSRFEEAAANAECIVVSAPDWPRSIPPRRLLALRYAGVSVADGPSVYEEILQRVYWQRSAPLDLLVSSPLGTRSAMALQAVYTNVIGLGLLLIAVPLLAIAGLALMLATGRSPTEDCACLGFQRIPFRLLRFRTRRRGGELPWIGKAIEKMRLAHLPCLVNVVRGEMALFGPPPVRAEFADRLSQLLWAYPHRFSVKPGLLGWSQCNLRNACPPPDEALRLEYDLYQAEEENPSLDLDILFRSLFRMPSPGSRGVDRR